MLENGLFGLEESFQNALKTSLTPGWLMAIASFPQIH